MTLVLSAVVFLLGIGWGAAELRRREAERQRDALRADAIRLLLRADELAGRADRLLRDYHAWAPQHVSLSVEPYADAVREAASAVDRVRTLTAEGRRLLDRREHGRQPE